MKITKLGHCCLVVETKGVKILTDPGAWTTIPELNGIDIVLITHEHADHLHIESLQKVLRLNPNAQVITNESVGKILKEQGISFEVVADKQAKIVKDILIEGFGTEHAEIFEEFGLVENTGYFIDNELFYPGDSFYNPGKAVKILALPVVGPWMNIKNAIKYAVEVNPQICFPVHDGMLRIMGPFHKVPEMLLGQVNIKFQPMVENDVLEV